MAVKLGSTVQELIDAVNDASQVPSNMVTTDTAQSITGTKTFMYTRVTGNTIYKSCEVVFENADGGQQSLSIDSSMSSSCTTGFVLPKILQEATFELGTALYNHCVILSGTNCYATFNVLCNNPDAFTSLTDMWNSVITYQKNPFSGYRIAASGRVYGSSISTVKIVDYVQFNSTAGSVSIHCWSLSSATTTTLTASFVSDSVISCNQTMN